VSLTVPFDGLLDYADHERARWRAWIAADPSRLDIVVQPGGRFPTVGALLDHVYLVERRHLARLEGGTPPDATGVAPGDWQRLFEYADLVAADLRRYTADVNEQVAGEILEWNAPVYGPQRMTRRRLLTHIVLHEVRHLAQIALAARGAGVEPPGNHDLIFFSEFA
jgi:uncharacterized damage-inducible protein DinB